MEVFEEKKRWQVTSRWKSLLNIYSNGRAYLGSFRPLNHVQDGSFEGPEK